MHPFKTLNAIAAPLPIKNIDTDMIIPKQFLKTIKRTGLGVNLFDEMRYKQDGSEIEDFVLNQEPYRKAEIIIAGDNFGCGSSREHAPWSLYDFGIKAIIAPSFADIFQNNCLKNGILPVALTESDVAKLLELAKNKDNCKFTVDLENQLVKDPEGNSYSFEISPFSKKCLIEGLDDISLTLQKEAAIDVFENKNQKELPWLYQESA